MEDKTMGNQQETTTQAEIGWLAGIIEGEGSITMNARKKHWKGWNGFGVDMQIYAVNTDAGIISKVKSILNKLGIEPYIYEHETNPIPRKDNAGIYNSKKSIMSVNINRMGDILKVLELILPHIAGEKQKRAEMIVEFIQRRVSRKTARTKDGSAWMDSDDWGIVKNFYALKGCKLKPEVERFLNDHTRLQSMTV